MTFHSHFSPLVQTTACPLNQDLAVLDQLLAALAVPGEESGLDLALDLRLELMQRTQPQTVLACFLRLQCLVGERHYLACYRLRRALEADLRATVNTAMGVEAITLRLDVLNIEALRRRCLCIAGLPTRARLSFHFLRESAFAHI